jgi:hypothetical protein
LTTLGNGAKQKQPIELDFFTKVKVISNLREQDGNIFFVLSQADKESNGYTHGLYQLVQGNPVRLVRSVSDYYLTDGGIVFKDIREDKDRERLKKGERLSVFQKLDRGYGEANEYLRLPQQVGRVEWVDRGQFFYTATYNHHQDSLTKTGKDALPYRVLDELPFWSNGKGDVSGQRSHLYRYAKGESSLLSDTLESVAELELSPSKQTLAYTMKPAHYGKSPEGNRLVLLDVATLARKEWSWFDRAT